MKSLAVQPAEAPIARMWQSVIKRLALLLTTAFAAETCNMAIKNVNYALLGVGGVGSALVDAIAGARDHHLKTYGVKLTACLVADSSGALVAKGGLDDAALRGAVAAKAKGEKVSSLEGAIAAADVAAAVAGLGPGTVVVDCSATDATVPLLISAVTGGQKVVSANKKPFSGPQADYDALCGQPRFVDRVRHESSVGAGLPAIAALQRLVMANDPVKKISGTFSGTLGYVMTGLQEGRAFSEVVLDAKEKGFTEPDPRDDLGGVDVARKALILARGLGWRLEMADVDVTPLYPPELAALSVPDFLAALPGLDAGFKAKADAAAAAGEALRYAANVEDGKLTVGLASVALASPLGSLSGTDNLVEYYTQWYDPSPLVVRGAGAGAGTTAAGVLADMLELAFTP